MPPDGPDMWLSYPPLAGKHLRVQDVQGAPGGLSFKIIKNLETECTPEHVLQVVILRKETFYIHFETESLKEQILYEFQECQEAGATMGKP